MADDLPAIDSNLDVPLPQVDPNSQLVPYRMSRTDPGGQPVVTTGYGPRARPPIQPPDGGGIGMPQLDQIYQSAFSKLPVDEAIKAADAATRYVAQRGYQRDLQSGADAMKTFAKWAPLLFKQATGLPEVFNAQEKAAKAAQGTVHAGNAAGLYRIRPGGGAETLVPPTPKPTPPPKLHVAGNGEIIQENNDGTFKQLRPPTAQSESGPVQSQPVLDPETKKPIEGLIATPSAGGKGMTVRLTPKAQADLTPSAAAEYFKDAPDIDRMMGVNPKAPGSFTRQMATNMVNLASRPKTKGSTPNPASTKSPDEPPKVTTKEQRDALPSGTVYLGPDGKRYRKP